MDSKRAMTSMMTTAKKIQKKKKLFKNIFINTIEYTNSINQVGRKFVLVVSLVIVQRRSWTVKHEKQRYILSAGKRAKALVERWSVDMLQNRPLIPHQTTQRKKILIGTEDHKLTVDSMLLRFFSVS